MSYRGTTIAGSVLAAILSAGMGLRVVSRVLELPERWLGSQVRRGVRVRMRMGPQFEELLEELLLVHAVACAISCRQRASDARVVAWSAVGCLEDMGRDIAHLRGVLAGLS